MQKREAVWRQYAGQVPRRLWFGRTPREKQNCFRDECIQGERGNDVSGRKTYPSLLFSTERPLPPTFFSLLLCTPVAPWFFPRSLGVSARALFSFDLISSFRDYPARLRLLRVSARFLSDSSSQIALEDLFFPPWKSTNQSVRRNPKRKFRSQRFGYSRAPPLFILYFLVGTVTRLAYRAPY